MSNVLGDLFQEIADAIRTKTGETDKIAPLNFPDEILSIVVGESSDGDGGGTSSGSIGNLEFASEEFNTSSTGIGRQTIAHGLSSTPDMIIVWVSSKSGEAPSTYRLTYAWGLNSKFVGAEGLTWYGSAMITVANLNTSGDTTTTELHQLGFIDTEYGMDALPSSMRGANSPYVYCPDAETFEVGADGGTTGTGRLFDSTYYRWLAISGIGSSYPDAESVGF